MLFLIASILASVLEVRGDFAPWLDFSTYNAMPGENVIVSGRGFAPNEGVSLDVNGITSTATATAVGGLPPLSFAAPFATSSMTANARGATSQNPIMARIGIIGFDPWVTAEPYFVIAGGSVHFVGHAFAPHEAVQISRNGILQTTVQADAVGGFRTDPFAAPFVPGELTYVFYGQLSGEMAATRVTVNTLAVSWLDLSTYYTRVGESILISGHGFGAGETVRLSWAGTQFALASADGRGEFRVSFIVPAGGGQSTVRAEGILTGQTAEAKFTYQIY